ncbi:MAG: hypothetical protein MUW56_14420 [Chryseobacterium sp.]|uniref:hypothetical protein n=1 Tax=Chryseobacterium sp. TaxID=1871047 RepID=UPI0025C518EF|nr:hypothetical protein [Chryseobacterium sp.]MCJ7934781.1 hypothetical protein [Chryseobacterium sp.]
MKKVILIAAFGAAGFVGAKPTDVKIVKKAQVVFQLCGVMVTYFDSQGRPYDQKWFTSDQSSLSACQSYQDGVIANLKSQGFRVEKAATGASTDLN